MMETSGFEVAERVRWEDVDLVGIVRYSAYTRFLDVGEAELFRAAGLAHPTILERWRVWLVRRVLHLEYHAPARFDALLRVRVVLAKVGRTSLTFEYAIWSDDGATQHATGRLVLVAVDAESMAAVELPGDLVSALTGALQER